MVIKSAESTRVCSMGFRSHFIELTQALLQSTKPAVIKLIANEGGIAAHNIDEWKQYLQSIEEDNERLAATLGGVEMSKTSTKGVFDFSTDEIMDRYRVFLVSPRSKPQPPKVDPRYGELDEENSSPTETRAKDGTTGDAKVDPREKMPDTDENGEGLGKNHKSLDQWLNQIINHPNAAGLKEDKDEDKNYNTANFWKEILLIDKNVLDLIVQELNL